MYSLELEQNELSFLLFLLNEQIKLELKKKNSSLEYVFTLMKLIEKVDTL